MIRFRHFRYVRAVFWFMAILVLFIGIASTLLLSKQRELHLKEAKENAEREISLIGTLSQDAMLRHDYATVESFIFEWAEKHEDVAELQAVTPTDFSIAKYTKDSPAEYPLYLEYNVIWEEVDLLNLKMVKDLAYVEGELSDIKIKFITGSIIFIVILGYILWKTLEKTAMLPLEKEIAERKRAEEALSSSYEFTRTVLDSVGDAISIIDVNTFKLAGANKTCLKSFGLREEDMIGQNCYKIFHHRSEPCSGDTCPLQGTLKTGGASTEEQHIHYVNKGTERIIEVSTFPIKDKDRRIIQVVHVARDITERKQVEDDLKMFSAKLEQSNKELEHSLQKRKLAEKAMQKAKEEAEKANLFKSQFLANMSHELRTPMNAVLGFSDLLIETDLDEVQTDYAETITSSGHVLLSLINDVLDLSKIEAGEIDLEDIDFDLEQLAASILKMIKPKMKEPDVELVFDISKNMPGRLRGDPTRIRQIIMNLLSNAAKFTDQGEIKLGVSSNVSSGDGIHDIRISVKDTGAGISRDKQETIFDAFAQEDSSTTREYGGTGLGLAIVSRLVQAMDGNIKLVSEKGIGSEFIVNIPLRAEVNIKSADVQTAVNNKDGNSRNAPRNTDDELALKGTKILLAEDNAVNLKLVKTFLDKFACDTDIATNGQEAMEKVKEGEYDIVLMDIQMPVMNGIEATEIIRRDIDKDVPIVALTAAVMEEDRVKSISAGMNDYLMKPVSFDGLKDMLLKWTVSS